MVYENREDAGFELANELKKLKLFPKKTIVVGIARGGVVVARVIADILKLPFVALVVKKIGAPYNPELAIGAVGSAGKPVLDKELIQELGIGADYVKNQVWKMRQEAKAREKFLGIKIKKSDIGKKVVIVADDGLATGQSAKAASLILKSLGAKKLILAVPVSAYSTLEFLTKYWDKIICPTKVTDFMAVGQFYRDFRSVADEEVKKLLTIDN